VLLVAFAATRLVGAWLANDPARYGPSDTKVTGDARLYAFWGDTIVRGSAPYSDVRIEYPPAVLPFLALPALWSEAAAYTTGFVALMVLVDTAGLGGLALVARRRGSWRGPWLWVVLVPLVGPLAYVRLDLVPAVATIWALERASARSWAGCGGWLGFGALAKLYPALLLPAAWAAAGRRARLAAAAAAVFLVPLLPLVGALDDLWDSVVGYHSARGLQVESTWALALLVAGRVGYPVSVGFDFGAFHVAAPTGRALEQASLTLALVVLVASSWMSVKLVGRSETARLAAALLATLVGVMVVGTVLSPQFLLWPAALAAAALSFRRAPVVGPALLLIPAAALGQVLYPFLYNGLLRGETLPLVLLGTRNALLLALAVGTWVALARTAPPPRGSRLGLRRKEAGARRSRRGGGA
jgi:hypothetical protein